MKELKSHEKRLETFIRSRRWKYVEGNVLQINTMKTNIRITPYSGRFRIVVGDKVGKLEFATILSAKRKVFDLRETGQLEQYLRTARGRRSA
jgi:hypothetical protein